MLFEKKYRYVVYWHVNFVTFGLFLKLVGDFINFRIEAVGR